MNTKLKKHEIMNILREHQVDTSRYITLKEFQNLLSKINNKKFNENITEEFFSEMLPNFNNQINLINFPEVYFSALDNLNTKLDEIKFKINDYKDVNKKIEVKIYENNFNEKNEEKKLILNILEIENYNEEGIIEIMSDDNDNIDVDLSNLKENFMMYFLF